MGNSEVTLVCNKIGISYGEVLGITLGVAEKIKLGGDEGSGQVLLYVFCEGAIYGILEDGIKEL